MQVKKPSKAAVSLSLTGGDAQRFYAIDIYATDAAMLEQALTAAVEELTSRRKVNLTR